MSYGSGMIASPQSEPEGPDLHSHGSGTRLSTNVLSASPLPPLRPYQAEAAWAEHQPLTFVAAAGGPGDVTCEGDTCAV